MWLDQVASELRQGLDGVRAELEAGEFETVRHAEQALASITLAELIEFGRWPKTRPGKQDETWLAVVRCCRYRDARLWRPVLLEMLAPALINETYRLALNFLHHDPLEINQQLVAEVLTAAASLPVEEGSRHVRARLIRAAVGGVEDWLRRTTDQRPLSLERWRNRLAAREADADEARWQVAELRMLRTLRPTGADLELVIRMAVLGQDRDEVARALGLPPAVVVNRFKRARHRLRRLLVTERVEVTRWQRGEPEEPDRVGDET
jgi:DNA-directed RNA polymerase specialized sigma24 family protein